MSEDFNMSKLDELKRRDRERLIKFYKNIKKENNI